MEKQNMVRARYWNHSTGETSVSYWRTEADAKLWLKATYPGARFGEYGIGTLSSTETVALASVRI